MKIDDLLEATNKKKKDSWVKKADDWVRGSWLQQQVDIAQKQTGNKGPASFASKVDDKSNNKKDNKSKKAQKSNFRNTRINVDKLPKSAQFKDKDGVVWAWEPSRDSWLPNDNSKVPLSSRDGARGYNSAKKTERGYYESKTTTGQLLTEGGNIFKTEPEKKLIAQRIATADVDSTVKWLNATMGFNFTKKEYLGTTGTKTDPDGTFEKNSSGDLDLNTDTRELPKEEIIAKLSAWCQKQGIPDLEIMNKGRKFEAGWIRDAGVQVHFRTPINGDPKKGFVQTDFMLTDNPALQRGAKRGGTAQFGGADRAVLLSSLARGRGYKFSPNKGVVDPNNGDNVVADDWDEIVVILLGKGATEADTHTVESMLAKLKGDPNYDELIAPWKETMTKIGKEVPEQTRYNEIVDLVQRIR